MELLVMLIAIVGVSMSPSGASGSMSVFGWLFAWRFIMGMGKETTPSHCLSLTFSNPSFSSRHWR
jgi:hypothetical protein